MAAIDVLDEALDLTDPVLVEGLPGVGLVGKIAVDHLVERLEMTHYASVTDCDGLPRMAMYEAGDRAVRAPVRLYADESRDLLALQSDVPIPKAAAAEFAACLTDWLESAGVSPLYVSGLPTDGRSTPPSLFGVATGDGAAALDAAGIGDPPERGVVSGPTGALLAAAGERDMRSAGLVVESNERFPDPEAARVVLKDGIQALADVTVPLDALVEQATEIQAAKEELAQQLQNVSQEERTEAKALRMYQ